MKYLVTYTENGKRKCFYTHWFDESNNFSSVVDMVVFNLIKGCYFDKDLVWKVIEEGSL